MVGRGKGCHVNYAILSKTVSTDTHGFLVSYEGESNIHAPSADAKKAIEDVVLDGKAEMGRYPFGSHFFFVHSKSRTKTKEG